MLCVTIPNDHLFIERFSSGILIEADQSIISIPKQQTRLSFCEVQNALSKVAVGPCEDAQNDQHMLT